MKEMTVTEFQETYSNLVRENMYGEFVDIAQAFVDGIVDLVPKDIKEEEQSLLYHLLLDYLVNMIKNA